MLQEKNKKVFALNSLVHFLEPTQLLSIVGTTEPEKLLRAHSWQLLSAEMVPVIHFRMSESIFKKSLQLPILQCIMLMRMIWAIVFLLLLIRISWYTPASSSFHLLFIK